MYTKKWDSLLIVIFGPKYHRTQSYYTSFWSLFHELVKQYNNIFYTLGSWWELSWKNMSIKCEVPSFARAYVSNE